MHSIAKVSRPLTLELDKPRGFSLQATADFYAGFVPGSGMASASTDRLTLAFRLDQSFEAVAVQLRETRDSIIADVAGTHDAQRVAKQIARMLGLEADGAAWLEVGRRDAVVGKLQREFPGFFAAAKPSPYDAAAWGVISPRLNLRAAAKLKLKLCESAGESVELFGRAHVVFPSPTALLALRSFPGLPAVKLERLHGIAGAALAGKLDAERLRVMPVELALAELQQLPGVGPWTASHILFRGAALRDAVPTVEPRLLHGLAHAYGLAAPSVEKLLELAEGWRPFRMWVCVLLARHLANAGGWQRPGLVAERAALSRKVPSPRRRAS
jgi:3-methyladenine DNA glycosylase/8-oxoguanine DNA glycosylase